jgi:cytochrome c-type biogenesis protein CcmH
MEEMTRAWNARCRPSRIRPKALYFLGRAYMAEQRPADAAKAFERAVALAGRQPELLGQWAQALYFAADKQWSPQLQALTDEALKADPKSPALACAVLPLRGAALPGSHRFWQRLLAQLPEGDASRAALQGGIDRAADKPQGWRRQGRAKRTSESAGGTGRRAQGQGARTTPCSSSPAPAMARPCRWRPSG